MNCADCRERLAEWTYEELDDETAARIREHLTTCSTCRQTADSFKSVRSSLIWAQPSDSTVRIIAGPYALALRAERTRLRWRLATVASLAVAAAIVFLFVSTCSIQWQADQLVVTIGRTHRSPVAPVRESEPSAMLHLHQQRISQLEELAGLLLADVSSVERTQHIRINELERRLEQDRREDAARWLQLAKGVRGLYLARRETSSEFPATAPN